MWKALAVATAALSLTAGAASALTVVNEDAKEYTLRVDLGEKETTHKIPANETVKLQKDVCPRAVVSMDPGTTRGWPRPATP